MGVLDDKMRIALTGLVESQNLIFSAIVELRAQGFATEATDIQAVLDDLITETLAAQAAV